MDITAISVLEQKLKEVSKEKDEYLKELNALKYSLSSQGISIVEGKPYLLMYAGPAAQYCFECPFGRGDMECSIHRQCYLNNKRYFSTKEIKEFHRQKIDKDVNKGELEATIAKLQRTLRQLHDITSKAITEEKKPC